jgi:cytoskeleton protein RodZ
VKVGSLTVGETLSHARRQHGLSVDDVAADTCIRATLISAIEADSFEQCGGAVYARGHIRSIARVVGVDPEPLVTEFNEAAGLSPSGLTGREGPGSNAVVAVAAAATGAKGFERAQRSGSHWTIAMAAALVAICGIAAVGLWSSHSSGHHPAHRSSALSAGATDRSTPKVVPSGPTSTPPKTSTDVVPSPHATMAVKTLRGESWVSITTKTGKQIYQGLIAEGHVKTFTNRHGLTYTIGNAPAVDVVVNGNDIGSPPASGAVAHGKVQPGADTVDGT